MQQASKGDKNKICLIIPTYNNSGTIAKVISEAKLYISDIYVVNDGSTDETAKILETLDGIKIISLHKNQGKGSALKEGFKRALSDGFDFAITMDSDGQHSPEDIAAFLNQMDESPDSLIVGARNIQAEGMPAKNTFANKFSNFWFWAETWQKLPDTQSGFRLYPIHKYKNTHWFTGKYEFELEVLVRTQWSDINVESISVCVNYAPEGERISHFKPFRDFARISVLNTFLVLIAYLYIFPLRLFKYFINNKFTTIVREQIMMHNENPIKISFAMGFGVMMGIMPVWGFQMLIAAFLAHLLKLNKIIVLAFSNISVPPIIPFIIYLSYKTGSVFFKNSIDFDINTLRYLKSQILDGNFYHTLNEFGYSILQYITGSLILGVVSGFTVFLLSWVIISTSKKLQNG